eukprot:TRINITY_DN1300_c0_g1_i1.p1 TRINITY_DN1300_c0_g1~~TRINITY_DN1300_c0_g1_i1.p1  ORF type:complete len:243 (+),score=43.06 TRINITY_DN1300_c0_g1_i1:199-927(+)
MRGRETEDTEVRRVLQSIDLHNEYAAIMHAEGYETAEDLITATEGDLLELGMKKPHMRRLLNEVKKRYPTAKMEQSIIDTATILGAERLDKLLLMKGYQHFGAAYHKGLGGGSDLLPTSDDRKKASEIAAKKLNVEKIGTRPCRHFNTKSGCWLADSCGFLHEAPRMRLPEQPAVQPTVPTAAPVGPTPNHSKDRKAKLKAAETSAARSNTQNRRTKICRHFEKGKCWLGERCAFLHEKQDA